VKLVHLVDFITKKFVTMHGYVNVRGKKQVLCNNCGMLIFRELSLCSEKSLYQFHSFSS